MLSDEIVSALARFFEAGRGPSHDELSRMFRRFGLDQADPQVRYPGETFGKMKRVREVLSYAVDADQEGGEKLVASLLGSIKASGGFRASSESYGGEEVIQAAREAFAAEGYELDPEGNLHPALLESLTGRELSEALQAYVRRAQRGSTDAPLVAGTSKDLLEAVARHVLVETTGSYVTNANFPVTLYQAFDRLELAPPPVEMSSMLDSDSRRALQQSLWLVGVSVNRLRNAEGTGHGRPVLPSLRAEDARLAAQAIGVVSQLLLDALSQR